MDKTSTVHKQTPTSSILLGVDIETILRRIIKQVTEGVMVALAAYFIPRHVLKFDEIFTIALVATVTLALVDLYLPTYSSQVRMGAGFGIGANLVGFPG